MTEIRKKYLGKEVVIVGEQIIAAYDDIEEAYVETGRHFLRWLRGVTFVSDSPMLLF